ncbi:serine/threonine-protein kinase HipA [Parabacteroides sp. PF5-5]|uniref:type II toxin-antitoxin system HipA family toxin n=1 Tax=unclassified Parabacteroides TaxID=2649774 RepID=UPI0024740B68|nr:MULTISPECIES: HipA domain-containing protein [unclassified Parabacteroides]MDH6303776.1 serine/threonine-protein kinase HipA [Parabacteroides sp. PH5-39]MDH6314393.1 serine/threonine-protein kinase HipA [Parabacteroides sp. PF5-13]MDH6318542.1 serine/threonine-protein kinase HipA [Parabacteroides sp. PH5-13]MDH6322165.1 serine/threonine-protein kinase HipA [Parabacteroides sp. PH5-8]MDH6325755.1 serine/threonine-protein kinase HipA [Parabacteroides sp. PH5-41]
MKQGKRKIYVYADWVELESPTLMGFLSVEYSRGKEIFSFEYAEEWLNSDNTRMLDPDLGLYSGVQYLRDEKANFGLFLDSSPDRWGRVLMKRREAILAKSEGRPINTLHESDFLLGVYDLHRMGALRFKLDPDGDFLDNNKDYAAPPWTSIRELEHASLELEKNIEQDNPDILKWLNILMAPGSSLGGARPKASVQHTDGSLWIAKFPSNNDDTDIGAWEMVVNKLAQKSGITMAKATAKKYNSKQHTYLTKRFDRTAEGKRIHFSSAMTLLGYTDGMGAEEGVSYLELVEFIIQHGANVKEDLTELFRRIVFSIAISNTDDHLRNHGFILTKYGWILSPAYDINPNPYGTGLKLNISEEDNSLDFDLVLSVAPYFRLAEQEAGGVVENIKRVVSEWEDIAVKYQISKSERDMMSVAFRY